MSDRFNVFFQIVERFENGSTTNGYVNNPNDSGGETIYGVTRKNHPNLSIWIKLDKLPTVAEKKAYKPTYKELEEIKDIYFISYYKKVYGDDINEVNLALNMYDMAVNAGPARAIKLVQAIIKTTEDGIMGPKTLAAINAQQNLYPIYKQARINYYNSIATGKNATFLKGWLNRVEQCKI